MTVTADYQSRSFVLSFHSFYHFYSSFVKNINSEATTRQSAYKMLQHARLLPRLLPRIAFTGGHSRLASQKAEVRTNAAATDGVQISESCVARLKQLCDNSDTFLRLSVEGGGCSGFQYKFDLDNTLSDDDKIFERDGAKIAIDETSLEYVKGSTIDFHTELIKSAFRVVTNPNADLGCSCGASFSVKID